MITFSNKCIWLYFCSIHWASFEKISSYSQKPSESRFFWKVYWQMTLFSPDNQLELNLQKETKSQYDIHSR